MQISLIIPCYNESDNLPLLLERCKKATQQHSNLEIILVDNGSTDNSAQVLEKLLPQHPQCRTVQVTENKGYGFGILTGLRAATGNIIGWTHADLQTDPCDVLKAIGLLQQHGQEIFIKGKRYGRPLVDIFFTIGMSVFETLLLRTKLWDINAQPTLFTQQFFASWENPPNDFSLDLYTYYMAKKQGLPVHRVPVRFGERAHGVSHWNVNWRAKWKFIKRTMAFSLELKKRLA